eukprot:1771265-Rhodomonas_salina.1
MSGTDMAYNGACVLECPKVLRHVRFPAIGLRACYAMSGTDLAYAATRGRVLWSQALCPYAASYAATGYGPTRLLRDVRY